jgi:glutamate synthase domain-containing protein 2
VDGGLKTGRHVVTAALLGADEFSFGTAAVIASGCIMARACHLNTCPVGVATQKQELRKKFPQVAEWVMAYFLFVAEETRAYLATLGARSLAEVIGRVELLQPVARPRGLHLQGMAIPPARVESVTTTV